MKQPLVVIVGVALGATLAFAEPNFRMSYPGGVPRVEISGDYTRSRYSVWRASAESDPFVRMTDGELLCLGSCYAEDHEALGGRTYWYRFDLALPDGQLVSFGPYAARIAPELAPRIAATVAPNPGRGTTSVRLFLAGVPGSAPMMVDASLHDLQGRRLAVIHRGPLAPGSITVAWDGRGADGTQLRSGTYFLRLSAADGRSAVTRVLRIR